MSDGAHPPAGFEPVALTDPFEIHVGPLFEKSTTSGSTYALRVDARLLNLGGRLHGGMMLTLADMTLGQAVWKLIDKAPCVTLNMQTQFLRAAAIGDLVEVVPQLLRRTRALVFMRGEYTVAGKTIFAASSVWKILGNP